MKVYAALRDELEKGAARLDETAEPGDLVAAERALASKIQEAYETKFAIPYKRLLDGGVKFYAALGNHDDTNQVLYEPFNMGGTRF